MQTKILVLAWSVNPILFPLSFNSTRITISGAMNAVLVGVWIVDILVNQPISSKFLSNLMTYSFLLLYIII